MRLLGAYLWLVSRMVPASSRGRWIEEWRAELAHGRRTMVFGAVSDALAVRDTLASGSPRSGLFHALPQDVR